MFDDDLLEIIFTDEEVRKIPLFIQSTVLHAIERAIFNNGYKVIKEDDEDV